MVNGETPYHIYQSDNSLLDSLYRKTYQGGLIFYLNTSNGTGLLAAPSDQSTGIQWGCNGTFIGGTYTAIGLGQANTLRIFNNCGSNTAAGLCRNLVLNGYSDWYLPSKDELGAMYTFLKLNGYGGFANDQYWSSTEYNYSRAFHRHFTNGYQTNSVKSNYFMVRAVRAF